MYIYINNIYIPLLNLLFFPKLPRPLPLPLLVDSVAWAPRPPPRAAQTAAASEPHPHQPPPASFEWVWGGGGGAFTCWSYDGRRFFSSLVGYRIFDRYRIFAGRIFSGYGIAALYRNFVGFQIFVKYRIFGGYRICVGYHSFAGYRILDEYHIFAINRDGPGEVCRGGHGGRDKEDPPTQQRPMGGKVP